MEIHRRPVHAGDENFLQRVFASTREGADYLPPDLIEMQFRSQRATYRHLFPEAHYEIILLDGTDAGELITCWASDLRLVNIALLPEFRCRGAGTALVKDLMREAESTGVPVSLSVAENNPAANIYRRLGFIETARSGLHLEMTSPAVPLAKSILTSEPSHARPSDDAG